MGLVVNQFGSLWERIAGPDVRQSGRLSPSATQRYILAMTRDDKKPSPDVTAYIDQNLKRVFADLEKEDVPERFQALLDQLQAQDASSGKDT